MLDNLTNPGLDNHVAITPAAPFPPRDRSGFQVAIICALPIEATAINALFDKTYDERKYGKEPGDSNAYSMGTIGHHNVVLVHMPEAGKVAAASAAGMLSTSFRRIQLALVVGVCGGVPYGGYAVREMFDGDHYTDDDFIFLGDVVISEGLIQYDLGRRLPDNTFMRKNSLRDNLPRPRPNMRAILAKLKAEPGRSWLRSKTAESLKLLRSNLGGTVSYPGIAEDKLYKPTHHHKHHGTCTACTNENGQSGPCDRATKMSCEQLGCNEEENMRRYRLYPRSKPDIHFGLIASGDTVMKSGEDRDDIALSDGVIAFEMEGAGVWESFPSTLVIKGVCDYADSHKSKKWQRYAAATAAAVTKCFLEVWTSGSTSGPHKAGDLNHDPGRRIRELEVLKKLGKAPYRDQKDRNPERVPETCEWFATHGLFREWKESETSSMLWVSADPGCGKSVLAKHLVDSVIPTTDTRTTCYFFFKDDFEEQKSVVIALSCILRQLFLQKRILLSDQILEQFEIGEGKLENSFSGLWDILLTAAKYEDAGEIVCVLDAIDECEDHGRSQLSEALCKFYGYKPDFNLKFLLTSRPYGEIRRGFEPLNIPGLPVIHLSGESEVEAEKISREIGLFVQARVKEIGSKLRLRDDEQELLLQRLISVPNRTYLWVYLTLDLIEKDVNIDKKGIEQATSHLPETVDGAYENILSKSRDTNKTLRLLHIIVAATRPLTLEEMNVALSIRENHQSYDDLNLKSEERFHETIRDLCGLFVTVVNSRVYLLHQTAKEFLVKSASGLHPNSGQGGLKWKNSLVPQQSHRILLDICVWHLLFPQFDSLIWTMIAAVLDSKSDEQKDTILSKYLADHVFLAYSANHWALHCREAHVKDRKLARLLLLKMCDPDSARSSFLVMLKWPWRALPEFNMDLSALSMASYFGLTAVVKMILNTSGIDINETDSVSERTALFWAAERGFLDIASLLMKGTRRSLTELLQFPFGKRPKIDLADKDGYTPLAIAAQNGHYDVVKLLIEKGANIECVNILSNMTPLIIAISNAHEEIAKLLIEKGANVEHQDSFRESPLHHATHVGLHTLVDLLLEKGVDPDHQGADGAALYTAAYSGHHATVESLLEKGANPNIRDLEDWSPLMGAIETGEEICARLLLQHGAYVNVSNKDGETPLSMAIKSEHEGVLKLVLEHGANINEVYGDGETPLTKAIKTEKEGVVKLVMEYVKQSSGGMS
ncbi:hypothetical protein FQN50_000828 [Emmonsiellopsis sp. PD_5]|nr:hypothetical protein FQN50_000828 [Emmonsiellopsis sp. PD_5]